MKNLLIAIAFVGVLVLPATALAKPNHDDKRAAIAQCKDERGKTRASHKAFKAKYHDFSRCVRHEVAEMNAARECKAERDADPAAFREKYGTNHNGRNAFGKCVSSKVKDKKAGDDADDEQEAEDG
jgi:hypothetical protein